MIIAIFDGKKLDLRRFYDVLLPLHMLGCMKCLFVEKILVLDFSLHSEEILTETIYYKNNINLAKNDFFVCCLIFFDEILRKILRGESACDLKISLIFNALFWQHTSRSSWRWLIRNYFRQMRKFLGFDFNRYEIKLRNSEWKFDKFVIESSFWVV